jgi:O-antigen biosynthesis protein
LCLTRNRRKWLPKAIQCFLDQTYPWRELLIVSDGEDVRDLVPEVDVFGVGFAGLPDSETEMRGDSRRAPAKPRRRARGPYSIRHIHLEGSANIGEKRNFGCDRARGDLIAHWDDDDWSAPGRLADQVERLTGSRKAVTGYRSMRFVTEYSGGPRHWFLYENKPPTYALGTSLMFRRDWWIGHKFPAKQICEDQDFVATAMLHDELTTAPAGELMYATMHDANTSPKIATGIAWKELAA